MHQQTGCGWQALGGSLSEEAAENWGRGKAGLGLVDLAWNWRHQYKFKHFTIYSDRWMFLNSCGGGGCGCVYTSSLQLWLLRRPRSDHAPASVNTARVCSPVNGAVSTRYSQWKAWVLLEESAHFKAWAGKRWGEPGTPCRVRGEKMLKKW